MDSTTPPPATESPWDSNSDFSSATGVHFTTASRYRNGERVPSTGVARRMAIHYGLDAAEVLEAISRGRIYFGHYVRMRIFGPEPGIDVDANGVEIEFPFEVDEADKSEGMIAA